MKTFNLITIGLAMTLPLNALARGVDKKQVEIVRDIIWAADKVEVPRELMVALCWGESNFRTKGVSKMDGKTFSYGICQMKLGTARFMDEVYKHRVKATAQRLENPRINAFYAAKYLKYQLKRYENDWHLAVDAYNKHNAIGAHTKYVKKFNKGLREISMKYGDLIARE